MLVTNVNKFWRAEMAEKYTLQQYAAMQGGHEMPTEENNGLTFMQSLGEARMYKSRPQINKAGARSITDHAFVSLLSLYAMSQDYNSAPTAKKYAKATASKGGFNQPSPGGTDLYQTLFTMNKPKGLFSQEKDSMLMDKVKFDQARTRAFLRKIETGNLQPGEAQSFFYKLEKDLAIQDPKLRAARRLTQNWPNLTTQQQTLVASQFDRYFRANALRSDMYPLFKQFAKGNNLIAGPSKTSRIAKRIARGAAAFAAGYTAGKMTEL